VAQEQLETNKTATVTVSLNLGTWLAIQTALVAFSFAPERRKFMCALLKKFNRALYIARGGSAKEHDEIVKRIAESKKRGW